ncbi:Hypothetical predicted protein, partial [Paramuricea clavata]
NEAYSARVLLAAIDHNYSHVGRKLKLGKSGKLQYNKVYSKRSKNWSISVIKEEKTYDYWPVLAYNVLKSRIDDKHTILHRVVIPAEHPKRIAPSIAMASIPKTSDLISKALTRSSREKRKMQRQEQAAAKLTFQLSMHDSLVSNEDVPIL